MIIREPSLKIHQDVLVVSVMFEEVVGGHPQEESGSSRLTLLLAKDRKVTRYTVDVRRRAILNADAVCDTSFIVKGAKKQSMIKTQTNNRWDWHVTTCIDRCNLKAYCRTCNM